MKNIKSNESMINRFFGAMDNDCLEKVRNLVEQGAVLNPLSGELILNNTRTGIFTDYFKYAFFIDEDERPYQVGSEKIVVASRKNPYGDDYQYICIEESPNGKECYGTDCRVYQFQIETSEDEWEELPIWFESREDATIYFN